MKRSILLIVSAFIMFGMSSCVTPNDDDDRNPLLNDDSFTNHTPWWVTNTIEGEVSNVESTKAISIQKD